MSLLLLALLACDSPLSPVGDVPPDSERDPRLTFALSDGEGAAGEALAYTLRFEDTYGPVDAPIEVVTDLEPQLQLGDEALTPTIAGAHVVTARARWQGEVFEQTAPLVVTAGAPDKIDLVLDPIVVVAGGSVQIATRAEDRWGNVIDDPPALTGDAAVVLDGAQASSTRAGWWTVSATLGDARDDERFQVLPGPPKAVSLALDTPTPPLDAAVETFVAVTDAYDNPTPSAWTLSVDRPEHASLSSRHVRFLDEGWHTVTVTVDGTELEDALEVLVDDTPPSLYVDAPERATWTAAASGAVSGVVIDDWTAVTGLTLNGTPWPFDAEGQFSATATWGFGLSVIEHVATDARGHVARDARSVLAGSFASSATSFTHGVHVRLDGGNGGLAALERAAASFLDGADLMALVPSPAFHRDQTFKDTDIWVTNLRFSGSGVTVAPQADGTIRLGVTLSAPVLDYEALVELIGFIDDEFYGQILADSLQVNVWVRPSVVAGGVAVTVDRSTVSMPNFRFTATDSWMLDVADAFGVDVEDDVQASIQDGLTALLTRDLPPLASAWLQDLELSRAITLNGGTVNLTAKPSAVGVTASAVAMTLSSRASAQTWAKPTPGLGSLHGAYALPNDNPGAPFAASFSLDLLDQLLYAAWGAGMFDFELDAEDLGLDPAALTSLVPDLIDPVLYVDLGLPPVLLPSATGQVGARLQLGEVGFTIRDRAVPNRLPRVAVYAALTSTVDLQVHDGALRATVADTEAWVDITIPFDADAALESLLAAALPEVLPMVLDIVGEVPIPDFAGVAMTGLDVEMAGPTKGYVRVKGAIGD